MLQPAALLLLRACSSTSADDGDRSAATDGADESAFSPALDGWAGSLFPATVGGRAPAPLAPGLYVVSTPVGNLEDVTLRALRTLSGVEAIYAEDTRTTAALLSRYGVRTPLRAFHAHNESAREAGVLSRLAAGASLALVSDAGTPLLSDPGALLAAAAARAGHAVFAVPGASALLAGLVVSGLPTRAVTFAGFLPAPPAQRRRRLKQLAAALRDATLALYVPPHKLAATLADAAAALGPERRCCVARELTKLHEEAWRSTLAEAAAEFAQSGRARGEVTLLIEGDGGDGEGGAGDELEAADADAAVETLLRAAMAAGEPPSSAARAVAERTGVRRKEVYARAMAISAEQKQAAGGSKDTKAA